MWRGSVAIEDAKVQCQPRYLVNSSVACEEALGSARHWRAKVSGSSAHSRSAADMALRSGNHQGQAMYLSGVAIVHGVRSFANVEIQIGIIDRCRSTGKGGKRLEDQSEAGRRVGVWNGN